MNPARLTPPAPEDNLPGLFNAIFHEVNEAIAITGRNRATGAMIIIDVNRQFEQKIGSPRHDLRGSVLSSVFPGVDEKLENILTQAPEITGASSLTLTGLCADGSSFSAGLSVKPFSSPTSSGEYILILRSPGPAASAAEDAMASRFLSSMSHDLRTPLNGILGFSEIMMTEMLGPIGQECYRNYAEDIHGAGRDLLRVIDGLLDVTSAISGQSLPQRRERFSLRACIAAAGAEVRPKASERGVRMTIRNPRGLPDTVGDYGRLLAAFAFVLANAVNRSPQGGSVSVRTQKTDGNMAEFICRDAGKSLSATELSHIFEPFRVNSDSFIANPVDFGVGFSLVRLTIEQHGGSITVKNAPHGGTLVKIRLPLASLA